MDRTVRTIESVPEAPVRLRVNDELAAIWTCSPTALEALGAGRLAATGYLPRRTDLEEIRIDSSSPPGHTIHARVSAGGAAAAAAERDHRREHGCGIRYLIDCRPDLLRTRPAPGPPETGPLPELFRELFEESATRRTTGGHHTVALSDGHRLLHLHEEVGRHNGVDKAIGGALLAGDDPTGLGLVTTARISAEIAEKAARAGLAWIASRSVPTTLAVEIAGAAGMAIIARAAGKEARVFHG